MLKAHPAGLTTNEARALGCGDRFAARVHELRRELGDHAVADEWETTANGERVKRFRWVAEHGSQMELAVA